MSDLNHSISRILVKAYYGQIIFAVSTQLTDVPLWVGLILPIVAIWSWLIEIKKSRSPDFWLVWVILALTLIISFIARSERFRVSDVQTILSVFLMGQMLRPLSFRRYQNVMIVTIGLLCIKSIRYPSPWLSIFVTLEILMITGQLFALYQAPGQLNALKKIIRGVLKMGLQTVPMLFALFILIPFLIGTERKHSPIVRGISGFSQDLRPGDINQLSLSNRLAFRAFINENEIPPTSQLYWRGQVLERGHGMRWAQDRRILKDLPVQANPSPLQGLRQRIEMEAKLGGSLFTLNYPLLVEPENPAHLVSPHPKTTFKHHESSSHLFRYRVTSDVSGTYTAYDAPSRETLQLPNNLDDDTVALVESLKIKSSNQREIANNILKWFASSGFTYTLNPGTLPDYQVSTFLKHKKGFCEHFAAAYATMLRVAGIPSRIVLGYHGGEKNPFASFLTITNRDAHAWVEAYFEDAKGWTLIDPTSAVAHTRIQFGGQRYHNMTFLSQLQSWVPLDIQETIWTIWSFVRGGIAWLLSLWDRLHDFYTFFFHETLFAELDPSILLLTLLIILYYVVRKLVSRQSSNRLDRLYEIYGRKLKKHLMVKAPYESHLNFLERCIQNGLANAESHRHFVRQWLALRFGNQPLNRLHLKELRQQLNSLFKAH